MLLDDTGLLLLKVLKFAAEKHQFQRRKDREKTPYINHPIQVAELLITIGGIRENTILMAALLHDTLEDTYTTQSEIQALCGKEVLNLVLEVTDDKSLPKLRRKELQIENAPHISEGAKLIKLADKICNVYDIAHSPPSDWTVFHCREYLAWSEQVVQGLRGVNSALEAHYDAILADAQSKFNF